VSGTRAASRPAAGPEDRPAGDPATEDGGAYRQSLRTRRLTHGLAWLPGGEAEGDGDGFGAWGDDGAVVGAAGGVGLDAGSVWPGGDELPPPPVDPGALADGAGAPPPGDAPPLPPRLPLLPLRPPPDPPAPPPGRAGAETLTPGRDPSALTGRCGPAAIDSTSAPATAPAITAAVPPAQPAADAGCARNLAATRRSSSRTEPNAATPAGTPPRQPARREARTA
jgi:hypothetical protein